MLSAKEQVTEELLLCFHTDDTLERKRVTYISNTGILKTFQSSKTSKEFSSYSLSQLDSVSHSRNMKMYHLPSAEVTR